MIEAQEIDYANHADRLSLLFTRRIKLPRRRSYRLVVRHGMRSGGRGHVVGECAEFVYLKRG
jgi:hypothetical protein